MTPAERNLRRRIAYHLDKARRACGGRPMVWGRDDCVLFHANIERAATGRDPAIEWRGRYRTMRGARRILGQGGLPAAMRRIARRNGCRSVKPSEAKVGDVGLLPLPWAYSVVRMLHKNEWIGRNDRGWSVIPTERVRFAWSAV